MKTSRRPKASAGKRLARAIVKDNLPLVRKILEAGWAADREIVWDRWNKSTAMAIAVGHARVEIARLLLARGADVNGRCGELQILHSAVGSGPEREHLVKLLLQSGANPNARNKAPGLEPGETALMLAAGWSYSAIVRLLLSSGADPKATAKDGHSALTEACRCGNQELAQLLMKAGCPVRGQDVLGAATAGNARLVRLLIAHGGKPDYIDDGKASRSMKGQTPLGVAITFASDLHGAEIRKSRTEVALTLLKAGADPNLPMDEIAPLSRAAFIGNLPIVKALLKAGADTEVFNIAGYTPLGSAAERGRVEVVKLLLAAGAKPEGKGVNGRGKPGSTPTELATRKGFTEIVRLLERAGARM